MLPEQEKNVSAFLPLKEGIEREVEEIALEEEGVEEWVE